MRLRHVVAVHHLEAHVAQALRDVGRSAAEGVGRTRVLPVVTAVAEEVVGARHALHARARASAHEAGQAHARLLPGEVVGPLERGAGVLPPTDAGEVQVTVLGACAVVVVAVHARAVVEEARAGLRLHERVVAVVERVVEAVVVRRAQRAVEALLVARRVAEVPARAVAVETHRAALVEGAPGRRARDWLEDAARAVEVERADDTEVAGSVEARIARAVRDRVAPGRALAVVWTRHRRLRNGAPGAVGVRRTHSALRVETVVAVAHTAGVVGVEPGGARLALLADHVARGVALLSYVRVAKSL